MPFYKQVFSVFFKNKYTYLLFFFSVAFFGVVYAFLLYQKPLTIFPNPQAYAVYFFNDHVDGGTSTSAGSYVTDSAIVFKSELRKGFVNPYSGLVFHSKEKSSWDVSRYNKLYLKIENTTLDNVFVHLVTKDGSVKDTTHRLASRHSSLNVPLSRGEYFLQLKNFQTPLWWYETMKQPESDFGAVNWSQVEAMTITTGILTPNESPRELEVSSIYFYKDNTVPLAIFSVLEFLLLVFIYIYFYVKLKKEGQQLHIVYKALDDYSPEIDAVDFFHYIQTHYDDSELTLVKVAKECTTSERVISKAIATQFQCNFKTYVNGIRVQEAQRLLAKSEFNISEIAYKVGFNSPSSFNKVFKKMTGKTPSDFN